jgi:hypothetical protein
VLATIDDEGRARLVPICFAIKGDGRRAADPDAVSLYSPLDEKPKRVDDLRRLARVRDIVARPEVTLRSTAGARIGQPSAGSASRASRRSSSPTVPTRPSIEQPCRCSGLAIPSTPRNASIATRSSA